MAVLYRAFVAPLLSRLENIVLFDLSEDAQVLSHGYIVSLAETDDLHRYRTLAQLRGAAQTGAVELRARHQLPEQYSPLYFVRADGSYSRFGSCMI